MPNASSDRASPFLNRVRAAAHRKGYTYQAEMPRSPLDCVLRRVPRRPAPVERETCGGLSDLVTGRSVVATQNQALNVLLLFHRNVLGADWDAGSDFDKAQEPDRLPVVLSRKEVTALLNAMDGPNGLVAHLLYGAGLRYQGHFVCGRRTWILSTI